MKEMNEDDMIGVAMADHIESTNHPRFEYVLKGEVYSHTYDAIKAFKELSIEEQMDIAVSAAKYLIDVDEPEMMKGWIRQVMLYAMSDRLWGILDDYYAVMIVRASVKNKVDKYLEDINVRTKKRDCSGCSE